MRIGMLAVCLAWGFLSYAGTGPPRDTGRFEEAVRLIKRYEGWHGNHLPYIGYGHRLLPGVIRHYGRTGGQPAQGGFEEAVRPVP